MTIFFLHQKSNATDQKLMTDLVSDQLLMTCAQGLILEPLLFNINVIDILH